MKREYLELLINLSAKAYSEDESPIAAIIVKDGEIISQAHNQRNSTNSTISHAEIIAITEANRKLENWRLNNCTMYVTVQPCEMCQTVIKEARIEKVFYIVDRDVIKKQHSKTLFVKCANEIDNSVVTDYKNLLADFWKNKR